MQLTVAARQMIFEGDNYNFTIINADPCLQNKIQIHDDCIVKYQIYEFQGFELPIKLELLPHKEMEFTNIL